LKDFFQFNVLHGRYLCGSILNDFKNELQNTSVYLTEDLAIFTVTDNHSANASTLNSIKIKNNNQVNFLKIEHYTKWISKVETLYFHIKNNYDNLPKYILYLDGLDTLILKDIINPSEYLEFYDCKILFNIENQYAGTGYEPPDRSYLSDFYNSQYQSFLEKNKEKYGNVLPFGLNAGVFLGEKYYILNLLKECLDYMSGDVKNGFPHGCTDDQYVFRYLHNKHYNIISADIFNVFSFWGGHMSIDNNSNNTFAVGYTKRFLDDYLKLKANRI